MIRKSMTAAAAATLLLAPAAMAQVGQQADTMRAGQQADTMRAGQQADTMRMGAGQQADTMRQGQMQQGQMQQGQMRQGQMQQGQQNRTGQMAQREMVTDREFLEKAISGNIKEVRLGEIARRNSQNEEVRQLGERLVEDHRNAYQAARGIATDMNMGEAVLDSMSDEHRSEVERFRGMTGAAFDSAFVRHAVEGHQHEVEEYRNQIQNGNEMAIRRYAVQVLPTLRDHLEAAQGLAQQMGIQVEGGMAATGAGVNDTNAYQTPNRPGMQPGQADTSAAQMPGIMGPDTTLTPGRDTTLTPGRDTTIAPGQNRPGQAGGMPAPPVRSQPDTTRTP